MTDSISIITIFLLILTVKNFENWSIFDEVIRRAKVCHIFGPPCTCCVFQISHCLLMLHSKSNARMFWFYRQVKMQLSSTDGLMILLLTFIIQKCQFHTEAED